MGRVAHARLCHGACRWQKQGQGLKFPPDRSDKVVLVVNTDANHKETKMLNTIKETIQDSWLAKIAIICAALGTVPAYLLSLAVTQLPG